MIRSKPNRWYVLLKSSNTKCGVNSNSRNEFMRRKIWQISQPAPFPFPFQPKKCTNICLVSWCHHEKPLKIVLWDSTTHVCNLYNHMWITQLLFSYVAFGKGVITYQSQSHNKRSNIQWNYATFATQRCKSYVIHSHILVLHELLFW